MKFGMPFDVPFGLMLYHGIELSHLLDTLEWLVYFRGSRVTGFDVVCTLPFIDNDGTLISRAQIVDLPWCEGVRDRYVSEFRWLVDIVCR